MLPLQGVTVLDISRLLPGGFASTLLSQLGARIIKIEQPGVGDYYRAIDHNQKVLGDGQFQALHASSESIGLDLKSVQGREVFLKLVRRSDVVIENFRPGTLKRLKIDFGALLKINRRMILCSVTGNGQKGPKSSLAGHDLNYLAASGLLSKICDDAGRPVVPDFQIVDLAAGFEAALKIVASLHQRKGVWLDCSMLAAGFTLARVYAGGSQHSLPSEKSVVAGGLLRYNVYETADRKFVALAALESKFWERFCRLVGKSEWIDGEGSRQDIEALFRSRTQKEWVTLGETEDVCLTAMEHLSGLGLQPKKKAPTMGQHTEKILKSLGYKKKNILEFKSRGIIA